MVLGAQYIVRGTWYLALVLLLVLLVPVTLMVRVSIGGWGEGTQPGIALLDAQGGKLANLHQIVSVLSCHPLLAVFASNFASSFASSCVSQLAVLPRVLP